MHNMLNTREVKTAGLQPVGCTIIFHIEVLVSIG